MTKCPNCRNTNQSNSLYCSFCGQSVPPQVIKVRNKTKDNLIIVGIILGSLLFSCFFCGMIGMITEKKDGSSSENTTNRVGGFTPPGIDDTPKPSPTTDSPKTLVSKPADSIAKTATVITENANLRDAPSSSGNVVGELSLDSEVEVIKQTGAWFYVSANGQKGWMHGNTIRYDKAATTTNEPDKSPVYETPRPTMTKTPNYREPKINNSGATAKCRDGTLSYSAHRRGTCSHHGGVAVWY